MKMWIKQNSTELILGIGLTLFLINFFTAQDEDVYVFSIPMVVYGLIRLYKRHFLSNSDTDSHSWEFEGEDELYERAKKVVIKSEKASTSILQKELVIGYSKAARLMDMLEDNKIISSQDGSSPRKILKN